MLRLDIGKLEFVERPICATTDNAFSVAVQYFAYTMARGKSWRRAEDLGLVRAIAAALRDTQSPDRGSAAFWQRVAVQFERLLAGAQAPPRTWTAVEGRWKSLRAELAVFVSFFETAGRDDSNSGTARVDAALKLFRDNDPKNRSFEHVEVWEVLRREIPRHEDFVAMSTSNYMAQKRRHDGSEGAGTAARSDKRQRQMPNEAEDERLARGDHDDDADSSDGDAAVDEGGGSDGSDAAVAATPVDSREQRESSDHWQQAQSAAEVAADVARYRRAKLEAYETRNALLAEQNAIATERNMITLFANRDDAMSREFFDLKRRLEIAKLRQEVADADGSR